MKTARRSAFASLLLGAGLAVVLVAGFAARSDWLQIRTDTIWDLETAGIKSELGKAWLAQLPDAVPRHPNGQGPVMHVCEDGIPLISNDNHSLIRQREGLASIWGENVYLSTRDGTAPASNGRSYTIVLPDGTESPAGSAVMTALMLGLALAAVGLIVKPTVPRIALTLAVLAIPTAPALSYLNNNDLSSRLEFTVTELAGHTDLVAAAATRPAGNTIRLMPPQAPVPFQITGPAAVVRQPVRVSFEAEDCLTGKDGVFRLTDTKCCLVGHPDQEMNAPDVGELVLTVRILEGDTLSIEWIQQHNGYKQLPDIVIPVSASAEWQTLRINDPLGIYLGGPTVPLLGFRLGNGSTNGPLVLEVGELIATDRRALYARSPAGHGPFERNLQRRPSHWQSAPGAFRIPWPAQGGRLLKGAICAISPGNTTIPFELAWEGGDGTLHKLETGAIAEQDDWRDLALRVPEAADPVALLFQAQSLPPDGVLVWSGWRLVDDTRPPRRVFLTIMDTLRADGPSCYGSNLAQTPGLDALAADGVRFSNAYSQSYWTRPSMASLMTGHYVPATGVHSELDRLPESFQTLAETFAQGGFYTASFITNTNAGPISGLDQGWDEQLLRNNLPPFDNGANFIETFVDPGSEHLLEEDLLFYVHLMDAHGPYGPAERPSDWETPEGQVVPRDPALDRPWLEEVTDAARVKLYYMSVEELDATWNGLLGRLRQRWDTKGASAPVVAVAADHGEFLGEYGQWSHIYYQLTPEVVHVPMIIQAPEQIPGGRVISAPVENIDLAPTLLELAGLSSSSLSDATGRSLVALTHETGSGDLGPALSSALLEDGLFAAYTEESGLLGDHRRLTGKVWPGGPVRQDIDRALGKDLLGRWLTAKLTDTFRVTWTAFIDSRRAVRESFWKDIDESVSQLDPGSIDQLRQMGYLR